MSAEENKKFILDYYEKAFNTGRLELFNDYFSDSFTDQDAFSGQKPGPEGVKESYKFWSEAFNDSKAKVNEIIAEGEKVVVHSTLEATHCGSFMGIKASGKRIKINAISIFRIASGKIIERRGISDMLSLIEQLKATE